MSLEAMLYDFEELNSPILNYVFPIKKIDKRTISEITGIMAEELGVEFKDLRLRGLFTLYYNKAQFPILFNYYSVKYKSGKLKTPPGCKDIKWFSLKQ